MCGVAVIGALIVTSGCDSGEPSPEPTTSASSKAAPARYSTVEGGCPTLRGAEAERYNASGQGKPDASTSAETPVPGVTTIDCLWAPADARPSMSVSISIFPNGFAAAGDGAGNARHFYDGLRNEAAQDAADASPHVAVADENPGFAAAYASTDSVSRTVLADNAVVTVVVRAPTADTDDLDRLARNLLKRVGPDAGALSDQVVAALR